MKEWKNITINLPELNLETISDELFELNIIAISIEDKREHHKSDWFHDGVNPLQYNSKTHKISILVDGEDSTKKLMKNLVQLLKLNKMPSYQEYKFKDQNWIHHTQNSFSELQVTNNLRIIPPWVEPSIFQGITIIINPGYGFGTGTHITTQQCLKWLEANFIKGQSLLDFGSGSGILSILGKKLGAKETIGIEIDPKAIENAKQNCLHNKIKISFYKSIHEIQTNLFDVVIANILSKTLISLRDELKLYTGKKLVLSGILVNQKQDVINAYSDWINLNEYSRTKEWVILEGIL